MKASLAETIDVNVAIQGAAAEKDVEIPWLIVPRADGTTGPIACKVRALDIGLNAQVRAFASEWAAEHGHKDAVRGDEIYDEGTMMAAVALSYLDPDSPKSAREPTFESPRALVGMHGERLAWLFARYEIQQSAVSPFTHVISASDLFDWARKVVESHDDRPFSDMSPFTQWSFTRGVARLLLATPELRSHSIALLSKSDAPTQTDSETTKPGETTPSPPPMPAIEPGAESPIPDSET